MLFLSIVFGVILTAGGSDEIYKASGMRVESRTSILWHWEDDFNSGEREKVEHWLTEVTGAVDETLGAYPFDVHYHIYRRNGSREPVPWANTRRDEKQGVNFHIDPTYPLQSFLDDWTAPHEISHLSIPFLGRNYAWFAEGYASFMQYQIMEKLGIYSNEEVRELYAAKLDRVRPLYDRDQDFVTVASELRSKRRYSDMYWGGASFFLNLDKALNRTHNIALIELIREYVSCCRSEEYTLEELISSWDRILGGTACSDLLESYQTKPASTVLEML